MIGHHDGREEATPNTYEQNKELFSIKFVARRRTYYLDAKEDSSGSKFITITEARKQGGKNLRNRVFIAEEDVSQFMDDLQKVMQYLPV